MYVTPHTHTHTQTIGLDGDPFIKRTSGLLFTNYKKIKLMKQTILSLLHYPVMPVMPVLLMSSRLQSILHRRLVHLLNTISLRVLIQLVVVLVARETSAPQNGRLT